MLRGPNGAGKTSILEAVGWLATQRSIRGATRDVLVRTGADRAVVRADAPVGARASCYVECELLRGRIGTNPGQLANLRGAAPNNGRRPQRDGRVFAPNDLDLGPVAPAGRREYLDDVLVARHARLDALVTEVERILRQRGAVLRQAGGRPDSAIAATLDVWDERRARRGPPTGGSSENHWRPSSRPTPPVPTNASPAGPEPGGPHLPAIVGR